MTRKVLITAALPYVNNVPHVGNLIGSTLSADVYARYCRSRGYETLYVCGTDEHGTATEVKAREEGVSPKQLCDKYAAIHKRIYDWFGIAFDVFGRTSDPGHVTVTQHIFTELDKRGFIIEKEIEQLYSEKDGMFLADRYVLGTCPKCSYTDARGDQCDKCGALLTPTELIEPRSAISGDKPVMRSTKHLFIDLAALQPMLAEWLSQKHFSDNTARTTAAWLARGLEPRAITRDLKWGVPVPKPGYENKVFYVWFDAPIGYISMTGAAKTPSGERGESAIDYWWHDPRVELYQFIGKDNIPFHSVLFPAMLLGTNGHWTTVKHINTTEFLNYEDQKFSKSRGTGFFGDQAMELGIPADAFRYYLLRNRPEQGDTAFSWDDFQSKLNGELVANLGNLVNRTLSFINQYFDGKIPTYTTRDVDTAFWADVHNHLSKIEHEMESVLLKDAIANVMRLSMIGNGFFQRHEPWRARRDAPEDCAATIATLANFLVDLAVVIEPFLPHTAHEICRQLRTPLPQWSAIREPSDVLAAGHAIEQNAILFSKVEDARVVELKTRFGGAHAKAVPAQAPASAAKPSKPASSSTPASAPALSPAEAFAATELVVGKIVHVEKHPNADKLFIERVDLGPERGERTIVSGLAAHYAPADLLHKSVVIVANLAPAKLRGVESHGMLLAAEDTSGTVGVITTDAPVGTVLCTKEGEEHGVSGGTISIDVFAQLSLLLRAEGLFCNGEQLLADGSALRSDKGVHGKVR